MSQEERALLLDKRTTEIGISQVVRIMKHGEFIPEGSAAEIGRQALKRRCTPCGKKVALFLSD